MEIETALAISNLTQLPLYATIPPVAQDAAINELSVGAGYFSEQFPGTERPLRVWYYLPQGVHHNSPILFVLHGVNRNAREYRDTWISHADRHGFLLLVPEFSRADYPGTTGYNLGNIISRSGNFTPPSQWTFNIIEHLFERVKALTGSKVSTYNLFGHSAGAQFVHRFVMLFPNNRVGVAIAANAGWYTFPTMEVDFPYGLGALPKEQQILIPAYAQRLIILLGYGGLPTPTTAIYAVRLRPRPREDIAWKGV
ncbi:MAG: hypothetical protein HC890_18390 [Chloroflexaceae bacterium]|nr:hypothetical protein [Chloroflexaceae bacterium]